MIVVLRAVVALLCCGGLYTAQHMYRKSRSAERGELVESSIVEEPDARLYFGQPNALFGCFYFPLVLAAVLLYALLASRGADVAFVVRWLVLTALTAATATSIFLAYRLVVTKRECPWCWTSHLVNVLLCVTVPWTVF